MEAVLNTCMNLAHGRKNGHTQNHDPLIISYQTTNSSAQETTFELRGNELRVSYDSYCPTTLVHLQRHPPQTSFNRREVVRTNVGTTVQEHISKLVESGWLREQANPFLYYCSHNSKNTDLITLGMAALASQCPLVSSACEWLREQANSLPLCVHQMHVVFPVVSKGVIHLYHESLCPVSDVLRVVLSPVLRDPISVIPSRTAPRRGGVRACVFCGTTFLL